MSNFILGFIDDDEWERGREMKRRRRERVPRMNCTSQITLDDTVAFVMKDLSAVLERSVKARKVTARTSRTNGASSICEEQGGQLCRSPSHLSGEAVALL